MAKVQKIIAKISNRADKVCRVISIVSLLFFFFAIFGGVLLRFVFRVPNSAMEDLTRTGFAWSCFLGAAVAYKAKALIRFRFFHEKLPEKPKHVMTIFAEILSLALAVFLVVYGIKMTMQVWPTWQIGAKISKGYLYMALPFGMLFMTIHAANFIMADVCALCAKEDK